MTKGKKGQNRKTVISKTAQRQKERKNKINKERSARSLFVYFVLSFLLSLCCIADHCLSFSPFFPLAIVLYC
jgi:hypothetical protein